MKYKLALSQYYECLSVNACWVNCPLLISPIHLNVWLMLQRSTPSPEASFFRKAGEQPTQLTSSTLPGHPSFVLVKPNKRFATKPSKPGLSLSLTCCHVCSEQAVAVLLWKCRDRIKWMETARKITILRGSVPVVLSFSYQVEMWILNSHCTQVLKTPEGSTVRCTACWPQNPQDFALKAHSPFWWSPFPAAAGSAGLNFLLAVWQWLQFRLLLPSALLFVIRMRQCLGFLWKPAGHSVSCGTSQAMLRNQFLTVLDFIWKTPLSQCFRWCHGFPQPVWQMSLPVVAFVPFL